LELHSIYPIGIFEKWEVDFVSPLLLTAKKNKYLYVATDYLSKWAETALVQKCIKKMVVEFIFNQIICGYRCPLEIVTN